MKDKVFIICCCRNAEKWIEKCIQSIQKQKYSHFHVSIYIDVCTDKTHEIAKSTINKDDRFDVIHSADRKFAALARWELLTNLKNVSPKDIIVFLDGDDWLYTENALEKLIHYYKTNAIVATHGNYITDKGEICDWSSDYPIDIKEKNLFRYSPWNATHLRSFKYGLFSFLTKDIILDETGQPFKSSTDFALFLPILELSGIHSVYIHTPLYVYNERNGAAMDNSRIIEQLKNESQIRDKKRYVPLNDNLIQKLI